ncbi:MAG: oligosaccharide flippase family protein [Bacilli bacterium]
MKSVNKNFIFNLIHEVIVVLVPLIIVPYVSRVIGVELIGVRSYTYAILTYFELFANLGISIYGQREIAKVGEDKDARSRVFFSLQTVKLISFSIVFLVYCITFFGIGILSEYKIIFAIWIIHLFESFFNIIWYFQGIEKFQFVSIRGIIIRIIQVFVTIIFINSQSDFYLYLITFALFPLLQGISLWPYLVVNVNWKQIKNIEIKPHLKQIFIFFIPTIATTIYSNIDKVMLGSLLENTVQAGYYESAQHITLLCTTIFTSLYAVMRSRISAEKDGDINKLNESINYFIKICMFIVLPITLGVLAVSEKFVIIFFGNEYEALGNMLKIFTLVILFMGISGFISAVFIVPFDKQKYLTIFYIIATVLNIAINFLLIPSMESFGAIVGSIVAEGVVLVGCFVLSRKNIPFSMMLKKGWKYIVSSLIMFIIIFFFDIILSTGLWQLIVEILLGVFIYFIMLIILKDELVFGTIKKFVARRNKNEN